MLFYLCPWLSLPIEPPSRTQSLSFTEQLPQGYPVLCRFNFTGQRRQRHLPHPENEQDTISSALYFHGAARDGGVLVAAHPLSLYRRQVGVMAGQDSRHPSSNGCALHFHW